MGVFPSDEAIIANQLFEIAETGLFEGTSERIAQSAQRNNL
jgi:hypothetical protein